MTPRYNYLTRIIGPSRVLYARLNGVHQPRHSRQNTDRVAKRIRNGELGGVVFDYRRATFSHDELQFSHLASRFAQAFTPRFPAAYIFGYAQTAHVMIMIRALNQRGAATQGFLNHRDAIDWACERAEENSNARRATACA
jgi:hypothetical protein